jgi:hypothetical protein
MNATWLAAEFRTAGLKVKTYDGWKERGRPASSGPFAPFGLLWHHTGTPTSMSRPAPTVATCIHGRSDLPGPLCHVVIGFDGLLHVIAAGRANHAGTNDGTGTGPIPAGDGNAQMIGFEIDYSGSQDMGPLQMDAALRASLVVVKHFKHDEAWVRGHKETSSAGKWDPGRKGSSSPEYIMGSIRDKIELLFTPRVQYVLFDGEGTEIAHSAPVEDKMGPRRERLERFLVDRVGRIDVETQKGDRDVVVKRRRA